MTSSSTIHRVEYTIKEKHLDLFGHVNNAQYFSLLEEARWDALLVHNLSLKDVQEKKIGPVILRIEANFKRELTNREVIVIETHFSDINAKNLFTINQNIFKKSEGEPRADKPLLAFHASFLGAIVDLEKRKIIEPPKEWQDVFTHADHI